MENVLPLLILLACPIGMGLMMLFMGKGMFSSKAKEQDAHSPRALSLDELKADQARLRAQIELLERRDRAHAPEQVPSGSS